MSTACFRGWGYTYPAQPSPLFDSVDLDIRDGGLTLLVGPSGAGKTTLLRALNGLVPHFTGGRIHGYLSVLGHDPVRDGPSLLSSLVGMVFQDPESQFVVGNVEDELAFAMENSAIPPEIMRQTIQEVSELLDIQGLTRRQIDTLSGGEQQRVAIAAALTRRPKLLVLDEPTSQLDPVAAESVLNAITQLAQTTDLTLVLAEHRLERVIAHADEMIQVSSNGLQSGPTRNMLARLPTPPPLLILSRRFLISRPFLTTAEARQYMEEYGYRPATTSVRMHQPVSKNNVLEISHLQAGYDGHVVIDIDELHVGCGELVFLLGRNGSGKSTLLKCIVGLLRPAHGQLRISDEDIEHKDTADICLDVAYLPQNPNALLFADTVADEFNITRRNHHLPVLTETEVATRLDQLRIPGCQQAYPRDLSVGERERAAIGAVTASQPKLIILDEPTRGLDYISKQALQSLLAAWKLQDCGILIVTHDVEFVAACADRVILLDRGLIVDDGLPSVVLRRWPGFTPQIAQVFPDTDWLSVDDVVLEQAH